MKKLLICFVLFFGSVVSSTSRSASSALTSIHCGFSADSKVLNSHVSGKQVVQYVYPRPYEAIRIQVQASDQLGTIRIDVKDPQGNLISRSGGDKLGLEHTVYFQERAYQAFCWSEFPSRDDRVGQ